MLLTSRPRRNLRVKHEASQAHELSCTSKSGFPASENFTFFTRPAVLKALSAKARTCGLRIVLEFDPGEPPSGRVMRAGEFSGRLELYSALERARAAES